MANRVQAAINGAITIAICLNLCIRNGDILLPVKHKQMIAGPIVKYSWLTTTFVLFPYPVPAGLDSQSHQRIVQRCETEYMVPGYGQ
jgi:hypothetical protein